MKGSIGMSQSSASAAFLLSIIIIKVNKKTVPIDLPRKTPEAQVRC